MFTSFNENRLGIFEHPAGGVAPLRHELALHDYLKRQVELREMTVLTGEPSWIKRLLHRQVSALKKRLSSLQMIAPVPHKLPR